MQICADFIEARGYTIWANVIGLRTDELKRAVKKDRQNEEGTSRWINVMPMVRARHSKADVRRFWFGDMQPADAVAIQSRQSTAASGPRSWAIIASPSQHRDRLLPDQFLST